VASAEAITYALLSSVASGRVYPLMRPQEGTLPAATTSIVSLVPQDRLTQTVGANLYQARIQVDCFAMTYSALKSLVDEVRAAVHLKSGTYAGKIVTASMVDLVGPDGMELDTGIYFQSVDFLIVFYD
jgi:hypothetical protein